MTWLISLLQSLFSAFLSHKEQEGVRTGEAIQAVKQDDETIKILNAELQASVDAPDSKTKMETLLRDHRL